MKLRAIKRGIAVALMTVSMAVAANAQNFTLDDLKQMVKELEAIAIKNDKYQYPIECVMDEDPDPNAYATAYDTGVAGAKPQALVALQKGMLDFVKGDKRIIRAIFAHEVGHLALGHCRRARFIGKDFENAWTRQQEMEADIYGAQLMQRLGYPKQDMIDMLAMLERLQGREGGWLGRMTADHPDPKARIAEIADNPSVFRSLLQFDAGLALLDCRNYVRAADLFEESYRMEPKLIEAYVNAGQCRLQDYWDKAPQELVMGLFRPDFGVALTDPGIGIKATVVTAEDRERYQEALDALKLAVAKANTERSRELYALCQILNPDKDAAMIQAGVDATMKLMPADADEAMRYVNNAVVGMIALKKVNEAYALLFAEWKKGESGSHASAENLARINVPNRSIDDEKLVNAIMKIYLTTNSSLTPAWSFVKGQYEASCKKLSITPDDIKPTGASLAETATIKFGTNEFSLGDKIETVFAKLGKADLQITFSEKWKDMGEFRWANGEFSIFRERGMVLRVTSYAAGSSLTVKALDESIRGGWTVSVGMTIADLKKWLNVDSGIKRELVRGGDLEDWTFFEGLGFGILVKDDKVAGITVTPIKVPRK